MPSHRRVASHRTYKERAQPKQRHHLGLLEKHKDYVLRARNFHKKQNAIQGLIRKAAFRNPDEFYHKMIRAKKRDNVYIAEDDQSNQFLNNKEVQKLKTGDLHYLSMRRVLEDRKIDRIQSTLHLIKDATPEELKGRHLVFVENDLEAANFDEAKFFNTPRELLNRCYNRPTMETINNDSMIVNGNQVEDGDMKRLGEEREKRYQELSDCMTRRTKLNNDIQKLDLQLNLMVRQ